MVFLFFVLVLFGCMYIGVLFLFPAAVFVVIWATSARVSIGPYNEKDFGELHNKLYLTLIK